MFPREDGKEKGRKICRMNIPEGGWKERKWQEICLGMDVPKEYERMKWQEIRLGVNVLEGGRQQDGVRNLSANECF